MFINILHKKMWLYTMNLKKLLYEEITQPYGTLEGAFRTMKLCNSLNILKFDSKYIILYQKIKYVKMLYKEIV